jgi:aspartyl-tRNA(Asn)/glutamyl-tRNA(Gln) amidotransferase subunit B
MKTTPIIGLEVHVELKTKSKMFCGCDANHFHVDPNTHTCPVCLGLPGALPVPNKTAIDWCIKLGLALGCTINQESFFERKNYFYPDLPKGYQISQYQKPFCVKGKINIDDHEIRINRVHQEEDTGKSVHTANTTLVDFNRSGVPLVEVVSEPDLQSPEEAKKFLNKMQQIVRYLGISDADIEKGSMRCEPTINVKIGTDSGETVYTPMAEIKNVASLTGVMTAIQFEIDRQVKQWQTDSVAKNELNKTTRGWDADKNQTFLQRDKEGSADYRYFPEPDIPPIIFATAQIEAIRSTLPTLPDQYLSKFVSYGLSEYDVQLLAEDANTAAIYDSIIEFIRTKAVDINKFAKFTANLFNGSIRNYLNESHKAITDLKLGPKYFFELFDAVEKSQISSTVVKQLIIDCYLEAKSPIEIAKEKGLMQISDAGAIEVIAKKVIADNPKAVADYRKNPMSIGFLVGQVMKDSKGSANPQLAKELLLKLLQ